MQQDIGSKIDLNKVVSWRLHWLTCELDSLSRSLALVSPAQIADELINTSTTLEDYIGTNVFQRYTHIVEKYNQLVWEVTVMIDSSTGSAAETLISSSEKYPAYEQARDRAKDQIRTIVIRASKQVEQTLLNHWLP